MHGSIFKVYDIRGIVGSELLVETAYQLGHAIAAYYKQQARHLSTIALGRDGRTHSPALFDEITRAFTDAGINVINLDVCTTPVMYFAQEKLPVQGGIMITASHNPPEYNGFKMMLDKQLVYGDAIQEIYKLFLKNEQTIAENKGSIIQHQLVVDYVYYLQEQFPHLIGSDISAVIDCANGATGSIIPNLVERFGWKNVTVIYDAVSGTPHHPADPTKTANLDALKKEMAKKPHSIGIGFDGDGDRMSAVTEELVHMQGDELAAIFAAYIKKKNKNCSIVTDISFSHVLIDWLEKQDITCLTSKVGHAFIKEKMKESDALLGAEVSCHFCFNDEYLGFDDGIYAMLRLFSLIISTQQSLQTHYETLPPHIGHAMRIPYEPSKKEKIFDNIHAYFSKNTETKVSTLDGICAKMSYGWGLIRPSNTEPVLSIRIESEHPTMLQHVKKDFYAALKKDFDIQQLKQILEL